MATTEEKPDKALVVLLFPYGVSQPVVLFVASSKRYSRSRVEFSRLLLFWGSTLPSQVWGRSNAALVSPKGKSRGDNSFISQQVLFSRIQS